MSSHLPPPERAFKGVWIPALLWEAKDISWMQKCIAAEIDSLDQGEGCYASNEYLARMFNSSSASIANQISDLRAKNYVLNVSFNGRSRRIRVNPQVKAGFTVELRQSSPENEGRVHPIVNIGTIEVTTPVPKREKKPLALKKVASIKVGKSVDMILDADGNPASEELVIEEWGKLPSCFPKIKEMSKDRRAHLKRALNDDQWVNHWREALRLAPTMPFLCGENERRWKMDFDWFIKKPDHLLRIIEGKYGGSRNGSTAKTVPLRENEVPRPVNVAEELKRRGLA